MLKEVLPDVWSWAHFSEEKKLNFNGLLIRNEDQWVLVDPPPAGPEVIEEIRKKKIGAILLTNGDHERMSPEMKKITGAPLWIHEKDAGSLEEVSADRVFHDGQLLPGGLRVIHLRDQKTPGESAFYLEGRKILIGGDALIGAPAGKLRMLPADKYADLAKAQKGLRRLLEIDFDAFFVGDGESIPKEGRSAVEAFLKGGDLLNKRCKPCEGGVSPFSQSQAEECLASLQGWILGEDGKAIRKDYKFKNFKEVIAFFNRIAQVAEEENHHPDLKIGYSRVGVELSTHAVKGLSENDFILAAKFDRCLKA